MKNTNNLKIALVASLAMPIISNAQVIRARTDINDFNSTQRAELANLIIDFVTPEILQYHCDFTTQAGNSLLDIHSDFDFLPFHRVYIERLEDWLIEREKPEYVPLPYWDPSTPAPIEFRTAGPNGNGVDPDCIVTSCKDGGTRDSSVTCTDIIDWTPNVSLPNHLSLPIQDGGNNDICDWNFSPTVPGAVDAIGLSRKIQVPWHNPVHGIMGGTMGNFRSPAAAIFWVWHAYVDDVWKLWECNCPESTTLPVDLYMKDNSFVMQSERDRGEEPNIHGGPMWESEDIWVRQQNDGLTNREHQNPEYYSTADNYDYVYVQVRNRGCVASKGNKQLKLYWAKASTALSWPSHWNGSLSVSNQSLGDTIGTLTLPVIEPASSHIAVFPWQPPNPLDYVGLVIDSSTFINEPHHFCLLARIESIEDPIVFTDGLDIYRYTRENNNVAWKNVSVVDLNVHNMTNPDDPSVDADDVDVASEGETIPGASILLGDAWGIGEGYYLEFKSPDVYRGNPITEEAEIKVTLSAHIWDMSRGGRRGCENLEISNAEKRRLTVKGDPARIRILSSDGQRDLIHVGFNFLSEQLSGQETFDYQVLQRRGSDGKIMGGETYHIKAPNREGFSADAGRDREISEGESADLFASDIGESAIYNWYGPEGNLIYRGKNLRVSPEISSRYKLEVIAARDGVKDYDDVEVRIRELEIIGIFPNPTADDDGARRITIRYRAKNVSSGSLYLIITGANSDSYTHTYPLEVNRIESEMETTVNLEGYRRGIYCIALIYNEQVIDEETLMLH